MLTAAEIRQRFLEYFAARDHTIVASAPLVPREDPSLLFTNAGMVQFKRVFLGQDKRPYSRAVSSQKCLRVGGKHNDLENVGRTARHHTFFEMLGNFSFGDYFKEEAIRLAWGFLTENLGLPKEKLYATVYTDDDEAMELWKQVAGLPGERIYRLGEKDNFWSMGDTGPCGPCSEILIDQGSHMACGEECRIGVCDCDRFLEVWNLVFMQYDRTADGVMTPLPRPSIDTGMGLERITAVCQGVFSNFDSDLFLGLITATAQKAGVSYGSDEETDTALRVIADHARAVAFMVADGMNPSNEGRGYVLRRLIRRAFRFGRLIGLREPFLHQVCLQVSNEMGDVYPELTTSADFMVRMVRQEEERFSETLDKGLEILAQELQSLEAAGRRTVPGDLAFKLYDTYGFPLDIVNDVAEKQGFTVDEEAYSERMATQKQRSREAWSGSGEIDLGSRFATLLTRGVSSTFVGYDALSATSDIVAMLDAGGESVPECGVDNDAFVVTAQTPFYGESGGQVGDRGRLVTPSGAARVTETLKPSSELTVHRVTVTQGAVAVGEQAELTVDEGLRVSTARNHTCTHLLHAALRRVLGDHVNQAGSLVGPDRLRFDFTHITGLSHEERQAVEDEVNRAILADIELTSRSMPMEQAVAEGAVALFGEKYAEEVRVVSVPGVSKELCGGTHLRATGQAGSFCILTESAVAAGVRRIEAATGWQALEFFRGQRQELARTAALLKAQPGELSDRVSELQTQLRQLSKENQALENRLSSSHGRDLMQEAEEIKGVTVLAARVGAPNVKALRDLMDGLRSRLDSGVILLAGQQEDKVMLILWVSKDLHGHFTAPSLIKEVAAEVGGSGGGRPDLAQAGGSDPAGVDKALGRLKELVAAAR